VSHAPAPVNLFDMSMDNESLHVELKNKRHNHLIKHSKFKVPKLPATRTRSLGSNHSDHELSNELTRKNSMMAKSSNNTLDERGWRSKLPMSGTLGRLRKTKMSEIKIEEITPEQRRRKPLKISLSDKSQTSSFNGEHSKSADELTNTQKRKVVHTRSKSDNIQDYGAPTHSPHTGSFPRAGPAGQPWDAQKALLQRPPRFHLNSTYSDDGEEAECAINHNQYGATTDNRSLADCQQSLKGSVESITGLPGTPGSLTSKDGHFFSDRSPSPLVNLRIPSSHSTDNMVDGGTNEVLLPVKLRLPGGVEQELVLSKHDIYRPKYQQKKNRSHSPKPEAAKRKRSMSQPTITSFKPKSGRKS